MPIYMDRHDLPGITAKDVAEAHQEDLKIQEKYNCRALTYWFDEERGMAFCLIEAPDKDSVKEMHNHAHGLVPHQLIEVDSNLVEAFLGRIEDPQTSDNPDLSDFIASNNPIFRTIMATVLKPSSLMNTKPGVNERIELSGIYNDLLRKALKQFKGREVGHKDGVFLASFGSVSQAVLCAIELQESFKKCSGKISASKLHMQIGLSAGMPVTESKELFGQTVQLAKRLCHVAGTDQIMVSSEVGNLHKQEGLKVSGTGDTIKIINPLEEKFLNRLMDITETAWNEAGFNVRDLAVQIGVSKSQLYRKTISLTGYSPNDFIKEFKLNKAVKLIEGQQGNISEIAYQSGFTSPSYFSKCFQKRFDMLPSDYATVMNHNYQSLNQM